MLSSILSEWHPWYQDSTGMLIVLGAIVSGTVTIMGKLSTLNRKTDNIQTQVTATQKQADKADAKADRADVKAEDACHKTIAIDAILEERKRIGTMNHERLMKAEEKITNIAQAIDPKINQ